MTAIEQNALAYAMSNYAAYNAWAHTTLVNWLRTKAPELMDTEVPSSFNTIRKTLVHIWQTQEYWFSVVSNTAYAPEEFTGTLEELLDGIVAHSDKVAQYVKEMREEDLQDKALVTNPWFECNFNKFEYLIQFVNHGSYHRGQIITIGRNLGFTDAPMTDYNYFNIRGKQ